MKIKVWVFTLIISGTVAVSCAGTFAAVKGVSVVSGLLSNLRQGQTARISDSTDNRQARLPQERQSGALPANFNAGVSIPGTYGEMTNRTEDEVLSAAEEAGTSTWGLAEKEGKLDELKQKVLQAVEASLKQMVSKGTVTQAQSDSYLEWVNMYLQSVGQEAMTGAASGFGQGNGKGWQQGVPGGTTDPGSKS